MEVIVRADIAAVAEVAASIVRQSLIEKPDLALALATGKTPVTLYDRLAASGLDFRRARFFDLDEFVGLGPEDPASYHRYLYEHLLGRIAIDPARVRLLRGDAPDPGREAADYEGAIAAAGGIDLAILGLGTNGHIAFNEPGSSLGSRTRVKTLERASERRFAITMGIGTILEARRLLVLATGGHKAEVVRKVVEGPISCEVPGSAIQLHPRVHLVLDEAAATGLARVEYYRWVYENKWRVGQ